MHIETLKSFCDLVETGSFSKAAAINFVSQSAISQQIRALEERYGRPLIERGARRGVVPTEAGRLLYAESKEIVERFRALEARLRQQSDAVAGNVRIATVYSVGLHELPPYIKQFIKAHPQVNIRVEYSHTDKVYEACLDNTIDFGIVALPLKRPQLEVIPLREEQLLFVCSPEHPLARRRSVAFKQLAAEPFIGFERDIPTRKVIDRILKRHGVKVDYAMEFDNIETIKRSVEAGIGVSILPQTVVRNEVRGRTLVALDFAEGVFTRAVGIIHRRGKVFSPAAREFIALLTSAPAAPSGLKSS